VGLGGFEPPTSPLSGVRSNQLSYKPIAMPKQAERAAGGVSQLRLQCSQMLHRSPVMKGHEDDGMFFGTDEALPMASTGAFGQILRKEVIQPQVPLRLPCYDFTPVAKPTVVACLSCELAQRLRVNPTPMV
jgi:hypothetical protein